MSQSSLDVFLVSEVTAEGLLMTESLLRLPRRNQRTFINAVSELANACGLISQEQFQHLQRHCCNVANPREAGGVQAHACFRTDTGQPSIGEWMQELSFVAGLNFVEGRRLR